MRHPDRVVDTGPLTVDDVSLITAAMGAVIDTYTQVGPYSRQSRRDYLRMKTLHAHLREAFDRVEGED